VKRIAFLFHPRIPESRPLAEGLAEELRSKGLDPWLVSAWEEEKIAPRIADLDLLVTLGGDGTVLRAARLAAAHGTPILAVNMGHLGFLAEAEPEEVTEKLTAILEGDYWVEERNMLQATLLRGGTQIEAYEALNDVVVARGVMARALHLTTSVDSEEVITYIADGVIVATATGSTAYSLAAGGPILDPRLRELLVTPIAPHLSATRSLVLPAHSEIEVTIESDQPATLTIDGQIHQELLDGDTVVVRASEHLCRLLRTQPRDYFYKTLQKRLK